MNQDERIANVTAEIRRLNGGEDPPSFGIDNLPKDIAEQFLQRIIDVEAGQDTNKIAPLPGENTWHVAIPRTRSES
jgi:hypothetical protein